MKLNESVNNQSYYRIITNFEGDSVIFEPKGYYEATDDEGNPIMHTGDVWSRSTTPEITSSKIIGGAILGLWSMGRGHTRIALPSIEYRNPLLVSGFFVLIYTKKHIKS